MKAWCADKRIARGATMTLEQAWDLSRRWYKGRLDAQYRRPTVEEATAIFDSVGLTGPFWSLR